MNEDVIADLKQFIGTTISQQTSDLREDLKKLDSKVDSLEQKMTDGFAGVGEAIEEIHSTTTSQDQRLTKLEEQAV
jgi:hypothetical protein